MGEHLNCMFVELEQAFCKLFWIVNDERVYLQLQMFKHDKMEQVKIYYECFMTLANSL